jgi:glycosyltransferase involved in cell wall biosynthesis
VKIGIVSPNPALNSGGVERFCHTLRTCLSSLGATTEVLGASDATKFNSDLLITNGMVGKPTNVARVHVYHGCWVEHVRNSHGEASLQWRTRFLVKGTAREVRAGRKAYRVAVSESAADEVSRWYRYSIQRVVPNGVDTAVFAPGDRKEARKEVGRSPSERIALFIGRPETRKRPDIAASAASQAGYRLFVAGSGSIENASSLGTLSPASLATWIRAADCVLAPSQYEACSLAILEALSVGTPVIASRVGWIPTLLEHVPSYVALTSPRGDVEKFTGALQSLSANSSVVSAAVSYVRANNSLDAFRDQWATVVEDAAKWRG